MAWANSTLQTYANRRAIVVSHSLLNVTDPATWTIEGQAIYDALKGNPNLFLMLCGHNSGESRRTDVYNDSTVHTLLADYQGRSSARRRLAAYPALRPVRR